VGAGGLSRPRIAVCGIAIEASTFSPHRSGDDAFALLRGEALLARTEALQPGHPYREAATWLPILRATSLPGGMVVPATYEKFLAEILDGLRAAVAEAPLDGLWLDIHGAMTVEGRDDAEGDLVTAIRSVIGAETFVAASMDLHGNVSEVLAEQCDHLTCYRMAPHEDAPNTRKRLARTLLTRLRGPYGADPVARRPWKAWVPVPVLLPGEKTSTRLEPATSLYQEVARIADSEGVEDAAFWIGYAWADQPRSNATVMVSADDPEVAGAAAAALAQQIWDVRDQFQFVAPTGSMDECLAEARQGQHPFVISDSGDNPTAGGAGDVTYALHHVLAHPVATAAEVIVASVFDADAVAACRTAGVGGQVDLPAVGAKVDNGPAGPVRIAGRVHALTEGDPHGGTIAVVAVPGEAGGTTYVIITERRKPYHFLADFTSLGLDPTACDVLVVKIGYLEPELYALAGDWRLALTPGGVDQDLLRLGHRRIVRPMYPFDPDMPTPDLTPRMLRRES